MGYEAKFDMLARQCYELPNPLFPSKIDVALARTSRFRVVKKHDFLILRVFFFLEHALPL